MNSPTTAIQLNIYEASPLTAKDISVRSSGGHVSVLASQNTLKTNSAHAPQIFHIQGSVSMGVNAVIIHGKEYPVTSANTLRRPPTISISVEQ